MSIAPQTDRPELLQIRRPRTADAPGVHALIGRCPPLDLNSRYCNLLQCTHFAATSSIALDPESDEILGFVSGYGLPSAPDTLFVWQVAVDERARGSRLGPRLIHEILRRPRHEPFRFIETSVTPSNRVSMAMFDRLARELGAALRSKLWFDRDLHFEGLHETEDLLTIGPIARLASR